MSADVPLMGGLVLPDPRGRVSAESLPAMTGRVTGRPIETCLGDEPAGLCTSLGPRSLHAGERVWVAADLDLTNVEELELRLGAAQTGAALLARLYELEGPGFVSRLRGAFSIALWDRARQRLLLAVDHFGIKRLYYRASPQGVAFASRASALTDGPLGPTRVDPAAVYQYLNFACVPAPDSPFADVRRLPPGHTLVVDKGQLELDVYWDMAYPEQRSRRPEAASLMYERTQEAVAHTLRGLPPKECGAFLSGGTDSSTVLGLMTRLTGERINAFSIGFQEERYNELSYAELAARHFSAAHYTRIITPDEALDLLPRLVAAYDEPFGNSSALGTFFCAQLARQCGVSRLLAGDGGDEIFGGNEAYRVDGIFARYHRIPAVLRRGLLEPALLGLPERLRGILGRGQRYIRRANIPNPRRAYSYGFFFAQNARDLLAPDFLAAVDPEAPWRTIEGHYGRAHAVSELNRLLYLDLKIAIGDNDLLKVTRTVELAGLGVRFPLLDLSLVEFTGTLPARFKVNGLEKRHLFKRAFSSLLPAETLAKRKHGFGVPVSQWLKTHPGFRGLARETLLSQRALERGYFKRGAIEDLFLRHEQDTTPFYGDILWTILMLELWHRRHGATSST